MSEDRNGIRAAVLEAPGASTRTEELILDPPRAGEVLVRMAASGVCHSDLHVRDGDWRRPGPIVLGHEGAGYVEALGTGVSGVEVGQLVALSWYAPCLRCDACLAGRQWLCSDSPSLGHRMADGTTRIHRPDGSDVFSYLAIGTFAARNVVPATAAVPMPAGTTPEVAALIGCCVSTGVGAVLKTAAVPNGASVAVIGLGGVGLSVVMAARLAGAGRIVAVDRVADKLERARDLGATDTVRAGPDDATTATAIARASGDRGPDFVFEAIGLPATIELAIGVLAPGGTAVLVGLTPFGARASFEVFPFVDGGRRILGSNYGEAVAAVDFPRYAELALSGDLPIERLIDRRLGLDELEDAFDRMRRGEHVRQVVTSF
jgi:S-(hydroxymethyl)glutathione dehydrogenase/alcohol dehydrogenase